MLLLTVGVGLSVGRGAHLQGRDASVPIRSQCTKPNATGGRGLAGGGAGACLRGLAPPPSVSEYVERSRFGVYTGAGRD